MGTEAVTGPAQRLRLRASARTASFSPSSAVRKALGPDQLLLPPLLQPIGSPLSTLPTTPSPAKASIPFISTLVQAPSSNLATPQTKEPWPSTHPPNHYCLQAFPKQGFIVHSVPLRVLAPDPCTLIYAQVLCFHHHLPFPYSI